MGDDAAQDCLEGLFVGRGHQRLLPCLIECLLRCRFFDYPHYGALSVKAKVLLVRLLAQAYRADWCRAPSTAQQSQTDGSRVVDRLINSLANDSASDAVQGLRELAAEESLRHIRDRLRFEAENHRQRFPQSSFEHLSVKKVCDLLDNKSPVNAADLAALVCDLIDGLHRNIRHGDTSDWKQYWEGVSPLDENACRDRFVSDLRPRLNSPLHADIEVHHADGNRSDVRITHGNLEIPVEAKKSHSADLWTAIEEQLIPRYTRSPGADGHGIYLVFWFGKDYCKAPPNSRKPRSPEELQQQLEAMLPTDKVHKIPVRVIDVSRP